MAVLITYFQGSGTDVGFTGSLLVSPRVGVGELHRDQGLRYED